METIRFSVGPFAFTFRGDRVWWRYSTKHFGTRIRASGATSISTVYRLRGFFGTGTYGAGGLETFVRFHMCEIPGAIRWAEHWERVRAMGETAAAA